MKFRFRQILVIAFVYAPQANSEVDTISYDEFEETAAIAAELRPPLSTALLAREPV